MKKLTTLAAISMFAVIMGMTAIAPALATPKGNNGTDTIVCHYFATYEMDADGNLVLDEDGNPIVIPEESEWNLLYVDNPGAVNGHVKHGDSIYQDGADDLDSCYANQDGTFSPLV